MTEYILQIYKKMEIESDMKILFPVS